MRECFLTSTALICALGFSSIPSTEVAHANGLTYNVASSPNPAEPSSYPPGKVIWSDRPQSGTSTASPVSSPQYNSQPPDEDSPPGQIIKDGDPDETEGRCGPDIGTPNPVSCSARGKAK